jgi:hypothetical protein
MARRALSLIALVLASSAVRAAAPAPAPAPGVGAGAQAFANAGNPPQLSGLWTEAGRYEIEGPEGYVQVVLTDNAKPAAKIAAATSFACAAAPGAFFLSRSKIGLSYTGAPLERADQCDLLTVNSTALAYAVGEGAACPAEGAAPLGALARVPSAAPDRSAEACEGAAAPGAAAPSLAGALGAGAAGAAVDVDAAFPPFAAAGGPPMAVGAFRPTAAAARGGDVFVGIESAPGSVWVGWLENEGLQAQLVEYRSHECTGEHAWRATFSKVFVWLNGTVEALAGCEAGRYDPATQTRLVQSSTAECPEPGFADADATYTDILLQALPALGSPDAPCGGGGAAAPAATPAAAATPAPPSAARAPRAAAAAAAAALLAGLAAL